MSTSVSNPLVCTECGRCFTRRCDVKRHALIHKPDAKRYYCAYPGCTHSSLQMCNLKTHYISRHLSYRLFECKFDGCGKSYTDASSLIKHEKKYHGFFRKAQKPYERRTSPSARFGLEPYIYVRGASEKRTPSPTPSLSYSNSNVSSIDPSLSSITPEMGGIMSERVECTDSKSTGTRSTNDILHEMIPELFPDPMYRAPPGIPSCSSSQEESSYPILDPHPTYAVHGEETLDLTDLYPVYPGYGVETLNSQEPNATYPGYGAEILDSNIFTLFDPFNLTLPLNLPLITPPFHTSI